MDADCATLLRVDPFTAFLAVRKANAPSSINAEITTRIPPSIAAPACTRFRTGRELLRSGRHSREGMGLMKHHVTALPLPSHPILNRLIPFAPS